MTEQLPDELKALFDAERAAPAAEASLRVSLRSRLATTVGSSPLGHAAAGAVLGSAGKTLVVLAVALATAAAVKHVIASPRERVAAATEPPPVTTAMATTTTTTTTATTTTPPQQPPARQPTPPAVATPITTAATVGVKPATIVSESTLLKPATIASESTLLKRAWSALASGDAGLALRLAEQDARRYPSGALGEERDAIQIAALARLGRDDEARRAATTFLTHYPESVHRALVERSIQPLEVP
jgi:hypothetical protein